MRKSRPSRDDFAQITDDLEFEKARLDRCDAQGSGVCPPKDNVRVGSHGRGTHILRLEAFLGSACEQTAVGP